MPNVSRLEVLWPGAKVYALSRISGQINGPGVCHDRLGGSSPSSEEVSSYLVKRVIASQVQVVDDGQDGAWSVDGANSYGSLERNDRCREPVREF